MVQTKHKISIMSKVDKNRRIRTKNMQCHSLIQELGPVAILRFQAWGWTLILGSWDQLGWNLNAPSKKMQLCSVKQGIGSPWSTAPRCFRVLLQVFPTMSDSSISRVGSTSPVALKMWSREGLRATHRAKLHRLDWPLEILQ